MYTILTAFDQAVLAGESRVGTLAKALNRQYRFPMTAPDATTLAWDVEPLSPAIGAEIHGLDLATPSAGAAGKALRALFNRHHVLVFRDQNLTPAQQLAFAETIGEPDTYPFVDGIEGFPTITPVLKLPEERVNFGGIWHSDTVYLENPPMATLLLARDLPPVGGDTLSRARWRPTRRCPTG